MKLKLGRVGMGRVLHLGPSWHGPSFMWAELAWAELVLGRVVLHPFPLCVYIYSIWRRNLTPIGGSFFGTHAFNFFFLIVYLRIYAAYLYCWVVVARMQLQK